MMEGVTDVHLRYWAGARAAAGTAEETLSAATVRDALAQARAGRGEHFARVVAACSLLVDGLAAHEADLDRPLTAAVSVEVLPPFAGGAGASRRAPSGPC
jgi:molybdopterin synthase sulfur carrier subunit